MRNVRRRWGLGTVVTLVAATLLALATTSTASAASTPVACGAKIQTTARAQGFGGVVQAIGNCPSQKGTLSHNSDSAIGTPPLLFNGGPVMETPSTGPLVVTPIFWSPSGYPMSALYKVLLTGYLGTVALASGSNSNVFSVLNEYYGTNGKIRYQVRLGLPVLDSHPLPTSACQVASTDTTGIYADGSGYSACLDDNQIQAEVDRVSAARGLPHNLSHIFVLYLPKHVESCFFAGSTTTSANACTINYQPSAAYCAYHSEDPTNAVYANMPYPVYSSGTGFSCGSEINFGTTESPNGDPDADVEISPTSHEIAEAITDPDTQTGWYDSSGFEIGDECAYVYGATKGQPGRLYNQVISGFRFLTQEEFSNRDFAITGGGCVPSASAEAP